VLRSFALCFVNLFFGRNEMKKKMAAIALMSFSTSMAHAVLLPGDLAMIGFNADSPDQIAVVARSNIAAGEPIS